MIASALLMVLQVLDTATAVSIRDGDRVSKVPIVFTRAGRMISADDLARALGTPVRRPTSDRFVLTAAETEIEFTIGVAFAKIGRAVTPLGTAPASSQGRLYVPLALVTDVLPRAIVGYMFDTTRTELRRFRAAASAEQDRAPSVAVPSVEVRPRAGPKPETIVVVDAGHGGPDRGMSGPIRGTFRIYEADITLQVAKRVRDALKERGIRVLMTRDRDTLIALRDRGRLANQAKGSVFLSIHVNAANLRWKQPADARGFETYFLAEAKTEDERRVEELENEATKYEAEADAEAGDPVSFILNDMKQNEHLRESSDLASTMQTALRAVHPGPSRGVKQAGFRVLVSAYMPAVLVEIGFGTNAAEARYIASPDGQGSLARAIADATVTYLAQLERRTSPGGARP
ncbi:MAG: N-acetylmuramoyl-L-alanine amidase [Gemmatimonadaceae bacterium]